MWTLILIGTTMIINAGVCPFKMLRWRGLLLLMIIFIMRYQL